MDRVCWSFFSLLRIKEKGRKKVREGEREEGKEKKRREREGKEREGRGGVERGGERRGEKGRDPPTLTTHHAPQY